MRAFLDAAVARPMPWSRLIGHRLVLVDEGVSESVMPVSGWLCDQLGSVAPGYIAILGQVGLAAAAWSLKPPGAGLSFGGVRADFVRPVPADTGELRCRASVVHHADGMILVSGRISSDDLGLVATVSTQTRAFEGGAAATRSGDAVQRLTRTVVLSDIVDSTGTAARVGESAWRELMARHDEAVRRELRRHRGQIVKGTGDGFVATFDSASQAIGCAVAIQRALQPHGLRLSGSAHRGG